MHPTRLVNILVFFWAVLTVLVIFVQLLLGSVVTTFQVGMADPVWPTAPWYLTQVEWGSLRLDFLIEHVHRLGGQIVGHMVILLTFGGWVLFAFRTRLREWPMLIVGIFSTLAMIASLGLVFALKQPWIWMTCLGICVGSVLLLAKWSWLSGSRSAWLGTMTTAALAGVIVQGLLGGFRVFWNRDAGVELAIVHGILAQIYFAGMFAFAVLLVPGRHGMPLDGLGRGTLSRSLHIWSLLLPALILTQVILGALLRHTLDPISQRLHLLMSFAVVLGGVLLIGRSFRQARTLAVVLAVLFVAQILLGVEAWMGRFSAGRHPLEVTLTLGKAITRVSHVLGGALVFGVTCGLAVWIRRATMTTTTRPSEDMTTVPAIVEPAHELEGVA
jgi:heme A synthase